MYTIYVALLYWITFGVSYLGLIAALWLGLYLVTRSPKYPIAWLTALTLWSLGGLFLNQLMAINPPPMEPLRYEWMRYVFPFWSADTHAGSSSRWLQGWLVVPAITFWHHVTTLMLPGRMTTWRWVRIILGYLVAAFAIYRQATHPFLYTTQTGDPLYLNTLHGTPLYQLLSAVLIIISVTCLFNLVQSARHAPAKLRRRQFYILAIATLVAGLTAPLSIAGSIIGLPVPIVLMSFFSLIPVGLIGYGVAQYSALTKGRTIQQDFIYNLGLLFVVVSVYFAACWFLVVAYRIPAVVVVLVPVLAVITHSLLTSGHRLMDWLFFRRETRQLRANLQRLVRLAGESETLQDNLSHVMESVCTSVGATYGLILTFNSEVARQVAGYQWLDTPVEMDKATLVADDVTHLKPRQLPPPLTEAALLIPLYVEAEQLGVLVLGHPVNGIRYAPEDVEQLDGPCDHISEAIYISQRKTEYMDQVAQLVEMQHLLSAKSSTPIPVEAIECSLRNLDDFTYLADTPLADLAIARARLPREQVTHLDRGKAVHEILITAIDKLRPAVAMPHDPPPREWYPYLIIQDAYLEAMSNRDIMQRLYISEGTFNRTRRAAVRSLARVLAELEANLS
jgi:hypothetical protein